MSAFLVGNLGARCQQSGTDPIWLSLEKRDEKKRGQKVGEGLDVAALPCRILCMKTKRTDEDVADYIASLGSERRRDESKQIVSMMEEIAAEPASLWGESIIGCGTFRYLTANGSCEEICNLGFSPRSRAISFYGLLDSPEAESLLSHLGKHRTSRGGCLYLNKLEDADLPSLRKLMKAAFLSRTKQSEAASGSR